MYFQLNIRYIYATFYKRINVVYVFNDLAIHKRHVNTIRVSWLDKWIVEAFFLQKSSSTLLLEDFIVYTSPATIMFFTSYFNFMYQGCVIEHPNYKNFLQKILIALKCWNLARMMMSLRLTKTDKYTNSNFAIFQPNDCAMKKANCKWIFNLPIGNS